MNNINGDKKSKYVQEMFGRIAGRYDLLNRLMTFGQDKFWRNEAITHLTLKNNPIILDMGCGTGDIAFEIKRQNPKAIVVASDFTPEMIEVGKKRPDVEQVYWVVADAMHLPFKQASFNGVVSGYLLRNVSDVNQVFEEQHRVLKPGGEMVSLDTTPPTQSAFILRPFLWLFFHLVIPLLGRFVAGDSEAYRYLPDSTEKFLNADDLAQKMKKAGFLSVAYVRRNLGTMAIHWGKKKWSI
jgi:demethylmenaquinone methyltransferase/2-methoxy-6-polyprenyl-1,4-benzoquinol methylase